MKILVDTHCWLWLQNAPERFSDERLEQLGHPATTHYLSAVSAWEIAIKYQLGKLELPQPPIDFIPMCARAVDSRILNVDLNHALEVAQLPSHHRDPFDRLLVAQARIEGMALLTADQQLAAYDVETIDL